MTDFIVRRGLPGDLERAGQLGGGLARLHHDRDPDRFFLPEQVEQGYAWWFGKELTRQSAVLLVALQGEALVGYAYGALEDRDWNLLLDRHGVIHDIFVVEAARRLGAGRSTHRALHDGEQRKRPTLVSLPRFSFDDAGDDAFQLGPRPAGERKRRRENQQTLNARGAAPQIPVQNAEGAAGLLDGNGV
jgi:hypothetical protein